MHEKGNITNILIESGIFLCVCMCVTNTDIMEKD